MGYNVKTVLCCLFLIVCKSEASRNLCTRFVFPTLTDNVVTAKEGDTVTLPFSLENSRCGENGTSKIEIMKKDSKTGLLTFCQITHGNFSCVHASPGCSCLEGGAVSYQFTKTVDRSDDTTWQWQTNNETAKKEVITFNVSYLARVTNLTMATIDESSSPFTSHTRVELVCTWEKGNPWDSSQQARLVDRHSKELVPATRIGSQLSYTFDEVRCEDAGVLGCEVPGANQNMTATLLVQCPPEFDGAQREFSVSLNTSTDIAVPVRTHSKTIKECTLTQVITLENETAKQASDAGVQDSSQVTKDCKGFSFLTGTPPDLTLTVRLDNVRKKEEGQWRLELTNDVGTGHVDFLLHEVSGAGGITPSKDLVSSSSHPENDDAASLDWRVAGTTGAVVFILIIAVAVSVKMIIRRRVGTVTKRRPRAPPKDRKLPEVPAAAMLPAPPGGDPRVSSASHQYSEVGDAIYPTKDRELPEVPAAAMLPAPPGGDPRVSSASHQYSEVGDEINPTED